MDTLSIDIETFSPIDLKSAGLYKYVEPTDFSIILFGYKFNDNPTQVIDLAQGEKLPPEIYDALFDPNVLKTAYNATFEITCINKWLSPKKLDVTQWEDTMFRAAYAGYHGGLDAVSKELGFSEDKQKDRSGKALIKKFSNAQPGRKRILPYEDPLSWKQFKSYNAQDVEVESAIHQALSWVEIPEKEKRAWALDYKIGSSGLLIETELVEKALALDEREKARLKAEITEISGIENPKSAKQMKDWINEAEGFETIESLNKEKVPGIISQAKELGREDIVKVLELRQELMKTSLAKYAKIKEMICADRKIRGILQFYGTHTGRWAGRGIQVQNLPRNYLTAIGSVRELFKAGRFEEIKLIYSESLSDIASQLIRTVFIPNPGKRFAVIDYSAIEARVISWLSGEAWRLEVFRTSGKIYEASAAQMFNVDFEKICDKNAPEHALRAQGKVAELALGYQGAIGAIARMDYSGAIPEDKRLGIITKWRSKNPNIVKLWRDCENAAVNAIKNPGQVLTVNEKIQFKCEKDTLIITIPSGRSLYYPKVKLEINSHGKNTFSYRGLNQQKRKIETIYSYGGKIVENVVSAIARDCLSEALLKLDEAGYDIKFHVHDEVIMEIENDDLFDKAKAIMCEPPVWAEDLPLNAEGFISDFYMKD